MKNKVIIQASSEEDSDSPLPELNKNAKLKKTKVQAQPTKAKKPQPQEESEQDTPVQTKPKAAKANRKGSKVSMDEERSISAKGAQRKVSLDKKAKAVVAAKPKKVESSSEEEDSEPQVPITKASKANSKAVPKPSPKVQAKKAPIKKVAESSEESSSEEPPKKVVAKKPVKKVESSSEEEDDVPIVAPSKKDVKKNKLVQKVVAKAESSSEEESEQQPKPKARKVSKEVVKKVQKIVKKAASSEEESSEEQVVAKVVTKTATKVTKKAVSSSEESEEEEAPKKPTKKVKPVPKKAESSEEESQEEVKPKVVAKGRKVSKEVKPIQDNSEEESEEKPRVQTRKSSAELLNKKAHKAAEQMVDENEEDQEGEFQVKVGGLSFNAYDEDVRSFFDENCGNVLHVKLLTRPDGKPRGLGFVKFSKKSSFNKALELNGAEHLGRTINVEEAYGKANNQGNFGNNRQNNNRAPRQDQGPANIETPTLFIGGLSYNSTAESIKQFFSPCGAVMSARVVTDKETGNPRGFGYVEFFDVDTAKKAYQEMNGQSLDGRFIRLDSAAQRDRSNAPAGGQRQGGFGGDRFGGDRFGGDRGAPRQGGRGGPRANSAVNLSQDDKNAKKGSIGGFAGKKMAL